MKNNTFWNEMAKPFVVLVTICLIAAGLLGYLNYVTAPVVEKNAAEAAEKTRKEVLPEADSFDEIKDLPEGTDVTGIFKAANGAGYVITSACYGYHGNVTVTVGYDADGKICGIKADVSSETSGVGTKAGEAAYLDKYMGLDSGAENVDIISNATYSSTAVRQAVANTMDALAKVK